MRTITRLWEEAVASGRSYPAFLVERDGAWGPVGWDEAGHAVDEVAAGFVALGIERGDRVAILGRTRLEWVLADLALASVGAITVPVYPTSSTLECAYVLGSAGARAVVCEGAPDAATVEPLRAELEALDRLVSMDEDVPGAVGLAELRERGRALLAERPDAVVSRRAAVREDDVLTILYTSGTTGPPKGCVLTHRHFWVMVDMLRRVPGIFAGEDRILLFLPLAHNFARLVEYAGAGIGFTIAFCPETRTVPAALAAVRPTIFPTVPRLLEKVRASVTAAFDEARGPRRALVQWALAAGRRRSALLQAGQPLPGTLAARCALAHRLVFSKVHARLGGDLRLAISGGAPLAREDAEFFHTLGILVLEGYGLTECTTASHVNRPDRFRFGTVGIPLPDVEARVAPDGEILLRGENVFARYYGDERATRETLAEDGWLRTEDLGRIDAGGFLTITGRKKEVIVTAGGKNVSPGKVENALRRFPIVANALVVGDRRPYIAALVTIDPDGAARDPAGEDVRRLVAEAVETVNRQLSRPEQIKRFSILPRDFLLEESELTPTLKLRRHVCVDHFRTEIDELYEAPVAGGVGAGPVRPYSPSDL